MSLAAILMGQFGFGEAALEVLRVIAGVGGAFIGWFVSDPLARLSYRLAAQKPIPRWTLPFAKICGAALVGLLVYFLIPLGGGPGGWGLGAGMGGGPGKGAGEGKDNTALAKDARSDDKKPRADDAVKLADKSPPAAVRKIVEIEVLGGERYPGQERYYLLRPTDKAMTLNEVDAYLKENRDKLELRIVVTEESPAKGLGIREDLIERANRYEIPQVVQSPPNPKKSL
jgi:hypothetical protein